LWLVFKKGPSRFLKLFFEKHARNLLSSMELLSKKELMINLF
jgi:hypothetical protein